MKSAILFLALVLPVTTAAQLAEQSKLTKADRDPAFQLTLEHLSRDFRAFGISPRDITWSPSGETVYPNRTIIHDASASSILSKSV